MTRKQIRYKNYKDETWVCKLILFFKEVLGELEYFMYLGTFNVLLTADGEVLQ